MLQRVLGEEIMRRGLMLYLERHQYGNANMDDLWHALSLGTLNSSHPVPVKVFLY
jgi:aminopeptidase N